MTTEATTYTGTDLWYPRICVVNQVTAATMSASTSATGYDAISVRGPQTYGGWKPTAVTATLLATFAGTFAVDYAGLYITDPQGCTFRPQYWNGSTYVNLGADVTPTQAGPVLWLFNSVNTSRIRFNITGGTGMPTVATMKAGAATVLPQGLPSGYRPSYLNPVDTLSNTFSEGGQILGSQLMSSMAREDVTLDNIAPSWIRSNWPTVRDLMRTEGVFWAWNADDYPDELMYGGLKDSPVAEYSSTLYMRLSFSLEGPKVL